MLILLLFTTLLSGHGQNQIKIKGIVYSHESYNPLAFASVALKNGSKGTVTNGDGRFVVLLDSTSLDDTLTISYLGYRKKHLPVRKALEQQNILYLKQHPVMLQEVLVSSGRAKRLIKKAIARVARNYPTEGMRMDAFYRAIVKDNGVPVQFSEAVFDLYKSAYEQIWRQDKIRLVKGRNKKGLPSSPIWDYIKFINGPLELLYSDIARHPTSFIQVPQHRINFLKERHFKHYRYQLIKTLNKEGNNLFVVQFTPVSKRAVFSGKIFIDSKDLAFAGLYYTLHPSRINRAQLVPSQTKIALYEENIEIQPTDYQCFVDYREINGKWYFNYAHISYSFMFIGRHPAILSHVTTSTDLAITEVHPNKHKRVWGRLVHWEESLKEMLEVAGDDFWSNENHIRLEKHRRKELNFMQKEAKE